MINWLERRICCSLLVRILNARSVQTKEVFFSPRHNWELEESWTNLIDSTFVIILHEPMRSLSEWTMPPPPLPLFSEFLSFFLIPFFSSWYPCPSRSKRLDLRINLFGYPSSSPPACLPAWQTTTIADCWARLLSKCCGGNKNKSSYQEAGGEDVLIFFVFSAHHLTQSKKRLKDGEHIQKRHTNAYGPNI